MADGSGRIAERYRPDIRRAVAICREEGCRSGCVFGSVAAGQAGPHSYLDLAVRGCPPERFHRLLGRFTDELRHAVDLVDLDTETRMADTLQRDGELVDVG
ncbi:MAG: nucleotidyltransferase domain-containing protein [Candidatus Latescibacterota bacterium]